MPPSHQDALLPPGLIKQLEASPNLPSLPAIAVQIIEASKNPDISLRDVASIISSDPAIAAKLLRLANSPLYSQRRTIHNLREALTMLGFNAALTIALSFTLFQSLQLKQNIQCNHDNYWKRSILAAEIARSLGRQFGLAKTEDLFLVGLLQDIGILALENLNPSPYLNYDKTCIKHSERINLERNLLQLEHSSVSAWLLESWNFPDRIVNAISHSHSLNNEIEVQSDAERQFHLCLGFSGVLADLWLEENHDELFESTIEASRLVLNIDTEEFNQLISHINQQLVTISSLFEINLDDEIKQGKLLDEANELSLMHNLNIIQQAEKNQRTLNDIHQRVQDIEKENRLDHLTKVYSRKYFESLLEDEFESARLNNWPLSVAFIDIDKFKKINDAHGHLVGDSIIIAVAKFFLNNIRKTDILARYGGDEFILMLPGASSKIAAETLKRLVLSLKKSTQINIEEQILVPTVSVGLATRADKNNFDDVAGLVHAADKALYKAKAAGRDRIAVY